MRDELELRRRDALRWAGVAGAAGLLAPWGCHTGRAQGRDPEEGGPPADACRPTPRQTEGPFFVRERPERADLRFRGADRDRLAGVTLDLDLRLFGRGRDGCRPLVDWVVDIWHCDAEGAYSAVDDGYGFGSRMRSRGSDAFLRGYQRTDSEGRVRFRTIYPGWYPGRAVHVHFKVRDLASGRSGRELTSQLYFADEVTRRVHRDEPYRERGAPPPNASDGIFRYGGERLLLRPEPDADGWRAGFDIGLGEL